MSLIEVARHNRLKALASLETQNIFEDLAYASGVAAFVISGGIIPRLRFCWRLILGLSRVEEFRMSEGICRVGSEVVNLSRSGDTNSVSAQVRLRYSFPDSGESAILTRVEVSAGTGERWRGSKRRIEASAWDWLEKYFDGACLDSDPVNIFSGEVFDGHTAAKGETSGLSPEQEEELQRELRQIELDFSA